MAKKEKKEEKKFLEFIVDGEHFSYSGRIYPGKEGRGKIKREWFMSLTLNGVLTISGIWLKQSEKGNIFLTFPQYAVKDTWKSYVFTDPAMSSDIANLVNTLCKKVKIEPPKNDDDIAEVPEGDSLPF